ncbi:MAG TPA: pyridoxamine 5'-phosphate oxidase [Xanthobacteraceae bacterium]
MNDSNPLTPGKELSASDFGAADEPLGLFTAWLEEAKISEPADANAMTVATVDSTGMPNARMVLLKGLDRRGFVFYTNLESRKGQELIGNPKAALLFHWKSLTRQVRVRGTVERVAEAEADAYFATRPKLSQIGAWASRQSAPLESRLAFEKAVALQTAKYAIGAVPRPPFWSGFRVLPLVIEFWHDRPFRLHDRVEYRRELLDGAWSKTRLYP